ncbi:MAG: carbohydrate binding family 9 domain-containing protein [Candidatus Eiseniibacteriota bacterium]|nr:MAG: carbohydrate binding family 9 domain-containing protein [Candidatus Eisenbacteria bacterium]
MRLKKVDSPIVVDGHVEALWNQADSTSDFTQFSPFHGNEPSRKTVAKLLATEHSLFCLILCYEEQDNIQRNTGVLDDFGGDLVSIMLDTFCDRRTAYKFAVSASGVRADCRLLDDARNRDYSWDGVWFSAAQIHDWGFAVEMEIPYRSILYDEELKEWGVDFDRWIPTLNEDIYWCKYEENEGLRVSKFGKLAFEDFYPSVRGLNLEIYPVGILTADYLEDSKYDLSPNAGIDIFYNPSQRLTFQLTGNPDFAQIEADPFAFNITRYESYFDERRPFFTEGNEVFMPSGRDRSSGFYQPLELFYSRRIGKKLPDGSEVPLLLGTKAVGRAGEWEYGGFLALTGEKDYVLGGESLTESEALFSSVRVKRQILENSSVGLLYVGKNSEHEKTGVIDIDGAFRSADWQLSYQIARSYKDSEGDFAASAGLMMPKETWTGALRGRYIGEDFDVDEVGFVPWKGTAELTGLVGPRWYFDEGYVRQTLIYAGGVLDYEKVDAYTDRAAVLGINMQFRNNWGYEISLVTGRAKELDKEFALNEVNFSSWSNISAKWNGSLWGGYAKTYNFSRDYLAFFSWAEGEVDWHALDILDLGSSLGVFIEGNPDNRIEDVTYNARPFLSLTPVNDLSVRLYLDNVYVRSTGRIEQIIGGLLFSYNFRPKSWIYLAINEVQDRSTEYGAIGTPLPNRLHVTDRACVVKVKYLFYF